MKAKISNVMEKIKYIYKNIDHPWIIGYSGGKDSTCTLQLVWQAIAELPKKERTKEIYVIYSDTMVETPNITNHLKEADRLINKAVKEQKLPITINSVLPDINNTFWVNLLGRGYPAPTQKFRWCTDRLKIQPANKFILDVVAKYGEAIIVLGARSAESASRAQVLAKHQSKDNFTAGALLPKHSTIPGSVVFTPIADWTTQEVWDYLLKNPNTPWGANNRDLAAMYKDATSGECPLVVDKSTPSCGNSRFGCWVCTLVESNKSLENMVDKGQEWLEPLLNYWHMLKETTDPAKKAKYRSYKRRRGQVQMQTNTDDPVKLIRGPYKFEYRKNFLMELLKTQQQLNANNKEKDDVVLITPDELKTIRKMWIKEENDWVDSVPKIYKDVTGDDLDWDIDDAARFGSEELELLDQICKEYQVPKGLVARLIDKEREFNAMGRRSNLTKELDSILKEEWRSEKEMMKVFKEKA